MHRLAASTQHALKSMKAVSRHGLTACLVLSPVGSLCLPHAAFLIIKFQPSVSGLCCLSTGWPKAGTQADCHVGAQRQRADDLQLIAQALLANETLDRDQIQEVLSGTLPKQALAVPERASPAQLSAPRPSGPADEAATPEVSTSGRSDGAGSNPSSGPAAPQEAAPPGSSIGSAEAQPDLAAGRCPNGTSYHA